MKKLLQDILKYCQDKYRLPPIKMEYKDVQHSRAGWRYKDGKYIYRITIAKFWFKCGNEVTIASLLHEISHIYQVYHSGYTNHNKYFKEIERMLLADFGLRAKGYKKAYYYTLETINGKYSWER